LCFCILLIDRALLLVAAAAWRCPHSCCCCCEFRGTVSKYLLLSTFEFFLSLAAWFVLLFIVSLNIGLEGDFLLCQGDWTVVAICCSLVLYEREVKETYLRDRRIDCDISEVCVSIEVLLKCVLFVLAFQYEKRDVEVYNSLENSTAALSKCF
jgi:hypothetical protein